MHNGVNANKQRGDYGLAALLFPTESPRSASVVQYGGLASRRGVLLLISLVLLSLFMLLGTSYIVIVGRQRACPSPVTLGSEAKHTARDVIDRVADDIVGGQPPDIADGVGPTASARVATYYLNSLLADKYGTAWDEFQLAGIERLKTSFPFFWLDVRAPAASNANNSYAGRILAINGPDQPNASFRILAAFPKQNGSYRMLVHQLNHRVDLDHALIAADLAAEQTIDVFIQGREFTGGDNDSHETYDAPDARNVFLAWDQPESTLGRDQLVGSGDEPNENDRHKFVIPSFHRPDLLLSKLKENPTAGLNGYYGDWTNPQSMLLLRPAGPMSFHPNADWQRMGVDWQTWGYNGPPSITGTILEHPSFTGSNITTVNGLPYYFDPVNGPWDVDNDGDGVTDSIWIDVGMPRVTINNVECQPLVALKIVDLDNRVNLNAHGTLTDIPYGTTAFGVRPTGTPGIYYAGTDPDGLTPTAPTDASLQAGLGYGVADINFRHLFSSEFDTIGPRLFSGSPSTGTQTTPTFTLSDDKIEGRFGDSVSGTGVRLPAPGVYDDYQSFAGQFFDFPKVSDLSIELPDSEHEWAYAEKRHRADTFGTNLLPATPISPRGITRVGLDQFGQPIYSRPVVDGNGDRLLDQNGQPVSAWQNDQFDDPYDLSLGRSAPRPGWSFDPDSDDPTGPPSTLQDNLFSPAQLERLLRLFDSDSSQLSSRLVSILGPAAERARNTTTTESWDSTAACIPLSVLEPLLQLSDQHDSTKDSLISWDLQLGLKMDINRPFGNGQDDNSNGTVDEPSEATEDAAYAAGIHTGGISTLANGRDPSSPEEARPLFARHLFVLVRHLCPDVPVTEAAQWAVNVVDFRDHDTAMTRFQYDETFSAGSTVWNTNAASPVVWGCERPELLLTEVVAWRCLRESIDPQNPAATGPPNFTWNDEGLGGLLIELYNPWTGQTDDGYLAQQLPAALAFNPNQISTPAAEIDLAKSTPQGDPVFQLLVIPDDQTLVDDKLTPDPTWPTDTSVAERVIYLGPNLNGGLPGDADGVAYSFNPANPSTAQTITPGQFAIVAGPVTSNPAQPNRMLLPIDLAANPVDDRGIIFSLSNDPDDPGTTESVVDPATALEVDQPVTFNPTSDLNASTPFILNAPLREKIRGTYELYDPTTGDRTDESRDWTLRQTAAAFPSYGPQTGPVGAVVRVTDPSNPNLPLRMPVTSNQSDPAAPLDAVNDANGKHRILLRRLADPSRDYNATSNPYITIDAIRFQEQAVISNAQSGAEQITLTSTERGSGVAKPGTLPKEFDPTVNNIWKQDDADLAPPGDPQGQNPPAQSSYSATYVDANGNPQTEVPKPNCGIASQSNTIEWTMGFLPWRLKIPAKGNTDTPPFPWLTWLNRDYASPHELLLVPKSSPFTLLRDHTHEKPFSHLFFGGGVQPDLNDPTQLIPVDPSTRFGLLELLRVPSPFADSEHWITGPDALALSNSLVAEGGSPLFLYPHNRLNFFREPGRVNLNTLSSSLVWSSINNGRPSAPYEDEVSYDLQTNSPLPFNASDDWKDGPQAPATGDWEFPDGDSLNDDVNNDGEQTLAVAGNLSTLVSARRGWPVDPTTQIAGQFDRVLNRSQISATNVQWFDRPFQSGWISPAYDNARSLLTRTRADAFIEQYLELTDPGAESYSRLRQQVQLTEGQTYTLTITFDGLFDVQEADQPAEVWQGQSGNLLPGSENLLSDTRDANGNTQLTYQIANTLDTGTYDYVAAFYGRPTVKIRSIMLRNDSTNEQLLSNHDFSSGTAPWTSDATMTLANGTQLEDLDFLFSTQQKFQDPSGNDVGGRPFADPDRNAYFQYKDVLRLSNSVSPRSNVFAVWMTVGFFIVEQHPTLQNEALGAEYGLDTGDVSRHKAFMLIDRSIPVGFHPQHLFNRSETHLIKRETE